MEKDTNVLELKDYLVSNNIEFQSNNLEMMKQKIKLALDYYLENS